MKREFKIRNRESYLARDPRLNELVAIVEEGQDRKPVAVAKQAFDYFYYKNRESFKGLKIFCEPYKLNKTKNITRLVLLIFYLLLELKQLFMESMLLRSLKIFLLL